MCMQVCSLCVFMCACEETESVCAGKVADTMHVLMCVHEKIFIIKFDLFIPNLCTCSQLCSLKACFSCLDMLSLITTHHFRNTIVNKNKRVYINHMCSYKTSVT